MKKLSILFLAIVLASCATSKKTNVASDELAIKYAAEINTSDLKEHLYVLTSDIL